MRQLPPADVTYCCGRTILQRFSFPATMSATVQYVLMPLHLHGPDDCVFTSGHLLHEILQASEYLVDLFKTKLAFPDSIDCPQPSNMSMPTPPSGMSLTSMAEYELLASILSRAYRTPSRRRPLIPISSHDPIDFVVTVPWDVREYCNRLPPRPNGFDSNVEDNLVRMFPALHERPFPAVVRPCCIVDVNGVILCWYLPSCLTFERQV
jgi:hypothetical protein